MRVVNIFDRIRSHWSQTIAVLTGSLGVISNGMEYGWASPAIPKLQSKDSPFTITEDDVYWLQMLYTIGGVCGLPVTFTLLQYLGRKKSLLLAETLSMFCWVLIATAHFGSIAQMYVARFLSGLAANCVYVGVPMYTAEVAEPDIRGFLGSFTYTMNIIGVVLVYSVVPYVPIYASAILAGSLNLLMLITFCWQPESPYFLLIKSKPEEAKKELSRLRSSESVDEELQEISKAVERQNSEKGRPVDLILIPSNRKSTLIMTLLNTAQNMCGTTVIIMNAQLILNSAGTITSISPEISALIFSLTMLVSTLMGAFLIDMFGRKLLLVTSAVSSTVFLGVLGSFFMTKEIFQIETIGYEWIPFFAIVAYAFAFKYGMGLVPIILTAELFPTKVKSMGMVLSDFWFVVMATLSLEIYHASSVTFGMYFPFMFFCLFGILTVALVVIFLPETKGKTLEEIQMILKGEDTTKQDDTEDIEIEKF